MDIVENDLTGYEIVKLLEEHLQDMYATSPAESVHALDIEALKHPSITFWSAHIDGQLVGCVALKEHNKQLAEIKSMRTATYARKQGVASQLLKHVIGIAKQRKYSELSLETGSMTFFQPARNLYQNYGFSYCSPFADYQPDPNSKFMTLSLVSS